MSHDQHNSRHQGDPQRRRRNRGGKNRRNNQQGNPNQNHQQPREFSPSRDTGSGRRGSQTVQAPRKYAPVKLTWWQKLMKMVGLYKEPVRPGRPERQGRPERSERSERPERKDDTPRGEGRPVKSNTRNLRTGDAPAEPAAARPPREGGRNRPERRGGDSNTVESPRVYVGNLSYDVSESDLQDLFKGIGGVRNVEIVYNRATHRSKGYGFVEMLHVDEAKRAVEVLHDQFFMGRPMTVSGAKSKGQDEREDREDADERQERRQRQAPVAAAAVAAVTAEELASSGEIATVIETVQQESSATAETAVEEVAAEPAVEEAVAAVEPEEARA